MWDELLIKSRKMQAPEKLVFLEETQKAILTALSQKGCFKTIVFQGGTALRLFHGNVRFSEDIDLVLKDGEKDYALEDTLSTIERFIEVTFPFLDHVSITVQKQTPEIQRYILKTHSDISEQRLRVHIEMARIPSYQHQPRILTYPPLHPVVSVEDPEEILADKVTALALRPYLKGRDLWDIHYLTNERGIIIPWTLVKRKVRDYNSTRTEYIEKMEKKILNISSRGEKVLKDEIERFLPRHIFEEYRPLLQDILKNVVRLVSDYKNNEGDENEGQ